MQLDHTCTEKSSNRVANQFPLIEPATYRLAIVGEAPGADEEHAGKPFVGMSGKTLDQLLSKLLIVRANCFVGNVCQLRPPGNDITKFDLDGPEIREGLEQLKLDLEKFKPNLVLLLGKTALWAAKGTKDIGNWRGSVFMSDRLLPANGEFLPPEVKCLATYHPAAVLRMYEFMPLLTFDLRRAHKEAFYPELRLPQRNLTTNLSYEALLAKLDQTIEAKAQVSIDIEGGIDSLSCLSIASSSTHSFIVPFIDIEGNSIWQIEQEVQIWRKVSCILADTQIPKVWQNGLYDRFVLQHSYFCLVKGSYDDTMLKWWECYCELEKALSVQASILTDEPYYKYERKTSNQKTFFEYCCKDSAVTFEINEKLTLCLSSPQKEHYKFNNALLHPLLYMELRGIRYAAEEAKERLAGIQQHIYHWQEQLDTIARELGVLQGIDYTQPVLPQVQEICCYKRDKTQPKKAFVDDGYWEVVELITQGNLSSNDKGRIAILCGLTMNTKSHKKFQDFLYKTCKLPTQWKKDPKTKEMKVTTDYESLLKLSKKHEHPALKCSLELSRLRTRAQMLAVRSINGRIHCSYNLVGSETGRVTSSKSNLWAGDKRVGTNMQTISDDWDLEDPDHPLAQGLRDLYLADDGCYLAKCDLKGADGWTVGAYMAMLRDPTMLDDLKFGLKPAQIVAYILKHGATNIQRYANDRHKLKELVSEIKKDDWEYFVSKQGIWGTCYTMGPRKLAERVFIESDGKVNLSEAQAKEFQASINIRYRVKRLHEWMQKHLDAQQYPAKLTSPFGFVRRFFGRKTEILGEALAHMPQVVTTWATLKAAYRLWTDPDNRICTSQTHEESSCLLKIEPLHQVHDELLVQFKKEDLEWALVKLKEWFNNSITVAGQTIVIPFDGQVGLDWAMKNKICDIK